MKDRALNPKTDCISFLGSHSRVWARVRSLYFYILRIFAAGLFLIYCFWWVFWLVRGKLPPALFLAITGLPSPTTGCTRSLQSLLQGNWRESLYWNAMSIPFFALFILSLGWLGWRFLRRQSIRLPVGFLYLWIVILMIAWAMKIFGSPAYW